MLFAAALTHDLGSSELAVLARDAHLSQDSVAKPRNTELIYKTYKRGKQQSLCGYAREITIKCTRAREMQ